MTQCRHADTIAVRAALETDGNFGAVVPPLYLASNFTFKGFDQPRKYDYTRSGNPTRDQLADTLAALEGGVGGVVVSTGMAAITLCLQLLSPGDLLVAPHDCYGGTYRLLKALALKGHFEVAFVNQQDETALNAQLTRRPKMVWLETPSNPLLRVIDIQTIAEKSHEAGALVVVDNTFLSPALQKPIALGADLVVHSATKYLNGHSDVVSGAVVAASQDLHEKLIWWANCLGITGAPFDSFMVLRGVRTLGARMRIHCENAEKLARFLDAHPQVEEVYYPGLENHPDHHLACRQQSGFGGMLSFELKGGREAAAVFLENLSCFSLAESLGGVESLVAHPATMTHASMDAEARKTAGIGEGLIRISVGVEAAEDLIEDLKQAFAKCARTRCHGSAEFAEVSYVGAAV